MESFESKAHANTHPLVWKLDNALQGNDVIDVRNLRTYALRTSLRTT